MTTTTAAAPAFPQPRRSLLSAGLLQGAVWLLVVAVVIGPFVPLLYASIRDRPLYEAGGAFTLQPYRDLFGDTAFWHAWWNTLQFAGLSTTIAVGFGAAFRSEE